MQYDLGADGSLTPLPSRNIDTGMGLDRMAVILQGVESVFDTDQLRPLVELGEELSGRRYGQDEPTTRALRILADHGRGSAFLLADGVVPSNEDRGYILRRIMRRALHQGRVLGIAEGFLPKLMERAVEVMGDAYPELREEWPNIERWARAEEEGFGRTLAQGERLLAELADAARAEGTSWISAEDAFKLHDTYGFPYEMTKELLAEQGLSVDDQGFEELMDRAREVSRAGARGEGEPGPHAGHEEVARFTRGAGFATRFVGYEQTEAETVLGAAEPDGGGRVLAKLEESPFYPEGGGQVSDTGVVESPSGRARVTDVYRLGDDQALALEPIEGEIGAGEAVTARVARDVRLATMRNHTATHLLHAALRERLGPHVRQAGSYVGPDKLRFDFTHGERLSPEELADVEATVRGWIAGSHPVHAIETTRAEAEALGAMALFGEKYGDWVRMVEIDGVSRELCGGTHVPSTGELGLFHLLSETSSASNVRRIEAVTGEAGAELFRTRTEQLRELAALLRVPEPEVVRAVERLSQRAKELQKAPGPAARPRRRGGAGRGRGGDWRAAGRGGGRARHRRQGPAPALGVGPPAARRLRGGARVGRGRPRAPGGQLRAGRGGARPQGGRGGERRGPGGRWRRRRPRHHGAGRRTRPREASRRSGRRAPGDRAPPRLSTATAACLDKVAR